MLLFSRVQTHAYSSRCLKTKRVINFQIHSPFHHRSLNLSQHLLQHHYHHHKAVASENGGRRNNQSSQLHYHHHLGGFETKTGEQWLAFRNDGKYCAADYAKSSCEKLSKNRALGEQKFWNPFEQEQYIKRKRYFIIKLLQGALRGLAYMHDNESTMADNDVAYLVPRLRDLAFSVDIRTNRRKATDAQLSTMVAEQVEQAQGGLKALASSEKTVNLLRENFVSIERLCQECQTLIENHDQIKLLRNARNNLNTTLKDVEGMMSISAEAAAAQEYLSDDKELINTYERLTALDGKRRFALAAPASHEEEVGRLRFWGG